MTTGNRRDLHAKSMQEYVEFAFADVSISSLHHDGGFQEISR